MSAPNCVEGHHRTRNTHAQTHLRTMGCRVGLRQVMAIFFEIINLDTEAILNWLLVNLVLNLSFGMHDYTLRVSETIMT